jgi:hypothetical protein
MAKLDVESLGDYTPPEPPKGRMELEIKTAAPNDRGDSLRIDYEIIDGQIGVDGESPVGTRLTDFVCVDMAYAAAKHNDNGRFAKQRRYYFEKAVGVDLADIDTDDLVGKTLHALVGAGKDKDGVERVSVKRYLID